MAGVLCCSCTHLSVLLHKQHYAHWARRGCTAVPPEQIGATHDLASSAHQCKM